MTVNITIRNVPVGTRDRIAERASLRGQSMQEYLLAELERAVARPTVDEWLQRARRRKRRSPTVATAEDIVAAIKDDGR
jgi:hypothetical protein